MKKLEAALPEKEVSKAPAGGDTSRCGSLKPKTSKAEVNRKPSCPSPRATRVRLNLDAIIADDSVRTRRKTDDSIAEEYAEKMKTGVKFPPIVVFTDDKSYWLSDGFHRLQAARLLESEKISAEVRAGTRLDALTYGFRANDSHGLRRTNADKRYAVEVALREFKSLSSRAIADLCGVGHQLVEAVRQLDESSSSHRLGQDGKHRALPVKRTQESSAVSDHRGQAGVEEKPALKAAVDQSGPLTSNNAQIAPTTSPEIPADSADAQPPPSDRDTAEASFQLADGSEVTSVTLRAGWIDAQWMDEALLDIVASTDPQTEPERQSCALRQRLMLDIADVLNTRVESPTPGAMHIVEEVLSDFLSVITNHPDYQESTEEIPDEATAG